MTREHDNRSRVHAACHGFTLTELMIALGIMVIGLSMVAASFPAAVLEHKDAVDYSMSTLICDNAAAISQTVMSHGSLKNTAVNSFPAAGSIRQDLLPQQPDRNYVFDRYGFVMAYRQIVRGGKSADQSNEYQVVIVPYRKLGANVTFTDVPDASNVSALAVGSPVIKKDTGEFAFVVDPAKNKLTRPLSAGPALTVTNPKGGQSPAIGCRVYHTAFAP